MGDVLFIVAFLGLLLIPMLVMAIKGRKGFWYWVGTVTAMGIVLGVGELVSKVATGMTLSSNFWALSQSDPGSAIFILVCWILSWTLLMIHLGWRMIRGRDS